jgi:predicted dehydrogenase
MIHDIDIILSVVRSPIKKIHANGVAVVSKTPDIANVRIEFDNGCVANLTASRISLQNMRKVRFFQRDAYITVDYLKRESGIVKMRDMDRQYVNGLNFNSTIDLGEEKGVKELYFYKPEVTETNAIQEELESFCHAIVSGNEPIVSIRDGYNALHVAHQIIKKLKISSELLKNN